MSRSRNFGLERTGLREAIWALFQLCLVVVFPHIPTLAQITPDTTLGAEGSRITPGANGQGLPADLIEGGAQRNTSLFHSFQEFNVNNGQRVYFANPIGIENIFTRVTGTNISNILGTLGVNGNANLFLLNPNGIIFGPNVRLDINGSFLATTANSFQFPGGTQFSATNPQAPPLLSINVPLGVQYGSQPGNITSTGNLSVGQDLTLAAGNLNLQGQLSAGRDLTVQAQDTVQVRDSAATPFIASAAGKLGVQGNQRVDIFALNHPNSGFYSGGDMVLRSANTIGGDAHYWSGESFRIETLDGSLGNLFSPYDPIILSSGDVSLADYTGASLHIVAGGSVTLGNVTITGTDTAANTIHPGNTTPINNAQTIASLASLTLSDGTPITIQGNTTPTLDVRAGVNWAALGGFPAPDPSVIGTNPNPSLTPASGANITVNGTITNRQPDGLVLLTNQFQPNTTTGNIVVSHINTVSNNSGPIIIDSRGNFTPTGNLDASTLGDGRGGDITIRAVGDVSLNGTYLNSSTFGEGDAGNIFIQAQNTVALANSQIFSSVALKGVGDGGFIEIQTGSLSLTDGAAISSSTFGKGDAGNVLIQAQDTVSLANGKIFSSVESTGIGDGGLIEIQAGSLSLTDDAAVSSSTLGQGDAGNVLIQAQDTVSLANGRIFSNVESTGVGNSGLIEIKTGSLSLTDDAEISSSTLGQGDAGNVLIQAQNAVSLDNSSIFSDVDEEAVGNGGNIDITAPTITLTDHASLQVDNNAIYTSANGTVFRGGRITTNSNTLFLDNEALITAETASGNGGDIQITVNDKLLMRHNSLISTTAGSLQNPGNGGTIKINASNGFVVAVPSEDSNILANAFGGQGGKINIQAIRVFGLKPQSRLTPSQLEELLDNGTSDISASSDVGLEGEIAIETLDLDPAQGLVELPVTLVDPTALIAQGCESRNNRIAQGQKSTFVVTGRGGLPPNPDNPLSTGATPPPWVTRDSGRASKAAAVVTLPSRKPTTPLVEAQGMVIGSHGEVILTAGVAGATPHPSGFSVPGCSGER